MAKLGRVDVSIRRHERRSHHHGRIPLSTVNSFSDAEFREYLTQFENRLFHSEEYVTDTQLSIRPLQDSIALLQREVSELKQKLTALPSTFPERRQSQTVFAGKAETRGLDVAKRA